MQEREKDLFQGYEIKNWNFTPRIYKILAAASIFNLLALFVVGQANLLTTRGCDSPMVSRVCQVLDTIYVGSTMLSTDGEFVSKDYDKTGLEDAEITYLDLTGIDAPLTYPEGYFEIANPGGQNSFETVPGFNSDFSSTNSISGIPGFPNSPTITNGNDLMNTTPITPTPNNKAIVGDIPTAPFDLGNNPVPPPSTRRTTPVNPRRIDVPRKSKINNDSPKNLPILDDGIGAVNKTDEKQADKNQPSPESEAVRDVEINKRPFEDLGDFVNVEVTERQVDLSKSFSVVLDGTIAADGKLDTKKSTYSQSEGDKQMVDVAKKALEAIGQSGFLGYLKNLGIDKINFKIVQDDKNLSIKIVSDQKNPNKANTTASGFNTLISGIELLDRNDIKKLDENSKTLIKNSKATSEGKNFVFNFELPKQEAQDLINRSLKERAEKKAAQQQPSSNAEANRNLNANLAK